MPCAPAAVAGKSPCADANVACAAVTRACAPLPCEDAKADADDATAVGAAAVRAWHRILPGVLRLALLRLLIRRIPLGFLRRLIRLLRLGNLRLRLRRVLGVARRLLRLLRLLQQLPPLLRRRIPRASGAGLADSTLPTAAATPGVAANCTAHCMTKA